MYGIEMKSIYLYEYKKLVTIIVVIGAVLIGLLGSIISTSTILLGLLCSFCGTIVLLVLSRTHSAVKYALLFVIFSVTVHNGRLGIPFKPDSIALPILAVVLLVKTRRKTLRIGSYPLLIPIFGFLIVNFASTFLKSPVYELSLQQSLILVGRAATFICVVLAIDYIPVINKQIPIYLSVILIVQSVISFIALVTYTYVPTPFVMIGQTGELSRSINGFFLEANLFAIFALSVVSLVLPILLFSRTNHNRFLCWSIIIGTIAIILSYTRSTWVGFLLIIGYISLFMITKESKAARKSYKNMMFLLTICMLYCFLLILIAEVLGITFNLSARLTNVFDKKSLSVIQRLSTWDQAINTWRQSVWLGQGLLSYIIINPGSRGWLYGSIIQTLHDTGIVGLFFMLIICGSGLKYSWQAYFIARDDSNRSIALGYFLAQLSVFFASQFSSFFWGGFPWVLMGIAVGHGRYVMQETLSNNIAD